MKGLVLLIAFFAGQAAWAQQASTVERGRYLVYAGGCISCHTDAENKGEFLAGGRALETPFGTFYSPNITPDVVTGIGRFSSYDFIRAFREGVNRDGKHYYPVFPYTSYTGITDEDLLAIKRYLFRVEPVSAPNKAHDIPWYLGIRTSLWFWKKMNFETGIFQPDPNRGKQWNRGAYLVRHFGHCAECHSPRNKLGGLDRNRELAGNPDGPEGDPVPNITPHKEDGIGSWSRSDIDYLLESGMLSDGDFTAGAMSDVVEDNTSKLTKVDRAAIVEYLLSIPPLPSSK